MIQLHHKCIFKVSIILLSKIQKQTHIIVFLYSVGKKNLHQVVILLESLPSFCTCGICVEKPLTGQSCTATQTRKSTGLEIGIRWQGQILLSSRGLQSIMEDLSGLKSGFIMISLTTEFLTANEPLPDSELSQIRSHRGAQSASLQGNDVFSHFYGLSKQGPRDYLKIMLKTRGKTAAFETAFWAVRKSLSSFNSFFSFLFFFFAPEMCNNPVLLSLW